MVSTSLCELRGQKDILRKSCLLQDCYLIEESHKLTCSLQCSDGTMSYGRVNIQVNLVLASIYILYISLSLNSAQHFDDFRSQ